LLQLGVELATKLFKKVSIDLVFLFVSLGQTVPILPWLRKVSFGHALEFEISIPSRFVRWNFHIIADDFNAGAGPNVVVA
jgi:hypothetical protein